MKCGKKINKTFNVECIIKWSVKIDEVMFWDAKCYIFWHVWWECSTCAFFC